MISPSEERVYEALEPEEARALIKRLTDRVAALEADNRTLREALRVAHRAAKEGFIATRAFVSPKT